MSLTSLLDKLAEAGQELENRSGERRERADQLLLPLWRWLQEVSRLSEEVDANWTTVDNSMPAEDEGAIFIAVDELLRSLDAPEDSDFEAALSGVRNSFAGGVQNAQESLRTGGLEAQSIAALFLPIRTELASWTHREESDEVLTRARSALTEVGATRLALSFNQQFHEDLKQANRFRIGAMFFFMLAVAWSVLSYATLSQQITAASVAGRGVIAVSLVIIGGFLTRESNRHRIDANVWRTVQLQLNAIEAFCSTMPRGKAEALRFMLGAAVFSGPRLYAAAAGREVGDEDQAESNGSPTGTLDGSTREILGIVRELLQASRAGKSS